MPSAGAGQVLGAIARLMTGRRLATALSAIGATALVTGAVVATELPGSSRGAAPAGKASGATTVQRRDLVATDTESGTLSYANPQTVFNRVSGTITSLPAIGRVIKSGQTLYRVDGSPVVLFNGTVPAYRDLTAGVTDGLDVQQLKQNLIALGFDPEHQITVNQIFDAATTAAVERWQAALGETETGTVTLGQIVFMPGAQRITSVDTVLGSTGGASSGASSGASAGTSLTPLAPRAQFVSLTTTSTTTGAPAAGAGTGAGSSPGTGAGAGTRAGAGAGPAVSNAADAVCPAPGASSPTGTTTTTTTTTATTPTGTSTTPTCDTAGSNATTTTTTTAPNTLITAGTRSPGSAKSGSRNPSQEAVLLALLKAETLELKKTLSSSRSSTSSTGSSGTGSSGSRSATTGTGSSGSRSTGASTAAVSAGASSSGGSATSGTSGTASAGSSAQAILQTTSNQLVVTVQLDATKQSEAVVGEPVSVQLPSGGTVGGRITQVSAIAQSSSSSSSSGTASGSGSSSSSAPSATIPVTIKIIGRHPVSGLDQAAVSVNFEQQVEKNVLSVPVTALLATAGGGYAVQEAGTPHRLLAVTPGLFAAGDVQISGADIYPGLQVTDSQG